MISIHAPVKGATRIRDVVGLINIISIHAPVKGATDDMSYNSVRQSNFNPRTREGCDVVPTVPTQVSPLFQSTHP